jgi:hypothetical protein
VTAIPLGRRLPGVSSNLPGRLDPDIDLEAEASAPSLFGLAPGGACRAVSVTGTAVRSYRTVSPLPRMRNAPRRFDFCGAVPGVAPAGPYPAPHVRGARTFLPGEHLSARAGAAVRPTDAVNVVACEGRVKSDRPLARGAAPAR